MRHEASEREPFKDRLRRRRMCYLGARRETQRHRVYLSQRACVLVRLGVQHAEPTR